MRLEELVRGLGARIDRAGSTQISGLTCDSRRVEAGDLFVALRGESSDGHDFAAAAARAGAAALVLERSLPDLPARPVVVRVPDTRAALPEIARRFFGDPGRDLTLIGVTGTNGKSSTVRLIESILRAAGLRAGSLGTISVRYPDGEEPATLTTPEAIELQRSLARMRDARASHVALEVSSHSLSQGRVKGLRFAAAVFTNLTQDHLDYHGDMRGYAEAKSLLFTPDYLHGAAVINADDAHGEELVRQARGCASPLLTYGRTQHSSADVRTVHEDVALESSRLTIDYRGEQHPIALPLPGDFQVENALAAIATALGLGFGWDAIQRGVESCPPIPGRLERVADTHPVVLVDYAHTPDALERVLARVRPLASARLISVFGCGGDRDRTKRAPMARAACTHSDYAIATSDNPRTEDPEAILRDVAKGLFGAHETIVDRRAAIHRAIEMAEPDDVIVIAGKGHEDYQILGRTKVPFDDRVEARRALEERGSGSA